MIRSERLSPHRSSLRCRSISLFPASQKTSRSLFSHPDLQFQQINIHRDFTPKPSALTAAPFLHMTYPESERHSGKGNLTRHAIEPATLPSDGSRVCGIRVCCDRCRCRCRTRPLLMVRTSAPPVLLPNWTSTSLRSLPLTPDSWFFDPHTIPDFGGSGFCEDASSGRRVQLKCGARLPIRCRNGINSALFLSAATPLPADISSPHSSFNHNRIIFHPETRSILCKSGTSSVTLCCLEQVPPDQHPLSHRVRSGDPSDSAVRFVRSYPLDRRHRKQSAGVLDLVDIQKHRTSDHILLNCVNGACIGRISKDGAAAEFEILSRIPVPAFPKSADLVFLSTNPFVGLEHEITAIVRSGHAAEASKTDYLMIFDCRSQLWRKTGKTGLTSGTRCMYSSNDHPRQVLVADDHSFKLCDHRVSESAASLLIFSSRKNAHLFPFEEIMSGTSFTRAHQHLVLSDMHVDLVDERFPGDSLLQVAHCADSRPGNRVSRIRCQEVSSGDRMPDQAPDALVLVSNDHLVCLLCLSPTRGVVQPQLCDSLVHAFHLNDFPDSLSSSGCDSWQSRMSRSRDLSIDGLDLIPSPAGFSLVAVTRNGDLFLQVTAFWIRIPYCPLFPFPAGFGASGRVG